MTISLVLFDALYTIVKPRAPIFIQYAAAFEPHLGKLSPDAIKYSFKTGENHFFIFSRDIILCYKMKTRVTCFFSSVVVVACVHCCDSACDEALKQVQIERPAYASGAPEWWGEVIKRTALGAGADPTRECHNLIDPPSRRRDASRTRS